MITRTVSIGLTALSLVISLGLPGRLSAQVSPPAAPNILSLSKPQAGDTMITFRGSAGPFRIQSRTSVDTNTPWTDITDARVSQIQPGVYIAMFPMGYDQAAFYRVLSEDQVIAELKGWNVLIKASTPANGTHFVVGEAPIITMTILDNFAQGITKDQLATFNLYMDGPQDPIKTVTALKLLNVTGDRTKTPHHFVNLKTNPNVQINGTTLTYALQPVTDEAPGTYSVCVRAVLGTDALQQIMKYVDIQIGTNVPEAQVVEKTSCIPCHKGTVSGKIYLHHIDPSGTSLGSWSYDMEPVRSCKLCHNNDGYASYSDASVTGGKVSDAIVLRVHGVHMGELLTSDFNTNEVTGNFRDYTHLAFPADVRNCTVCHKTDVWKTAPTRMACGSCHDNTWFGSAATLPPGRVLHGGGQRNDDSRCSACHDSDSITENHVSQVVPPNFQDKVTLTMSTPANGKFYIAGEKPTVSIQVTDIASSTVINPTNMVDPLVSTNVQPNEWKRANLFVSGPRADTVPVLTTAADAAVPSASYANNELRYMRSASKRDPRITRTDTAIIYQLDDVTNLAAGTYTVFADIMPQAFPGGWAYINFQVGTTNIESVVAGNCTDCHGDSRMHATSRAVPLIPDICKSCHDNLNQFTGKTNWTDSQNGFGVSPLNRRVHGIHFGNYLAKPDEVVSGGSLSRVIFPQDIRNCTKCHISSSWNEKPSRVACLACHDSDVAQAHATIMTADPTLVDPWSGDERETCTLCHGAKSDFSAAKVHSISNPYVPPYLRAPRPDPE
jgi:hypothetical protein